MRGGYLGREVGVWRGECLGREIGVWGKVPMKMCSFCGVLCSETIRRTSNGQNSHRHAQQSLQRPIGLIWRLNWSGQYLFVHQCTALRRTKSLVLSNRIASKSGMTREMGWRARFCQAACFPSMVFTPLPKATAPYLKVCARPLLLL